MFSNSTGAIGYGEILGDLQSVGNISTLASYTGDDLLYVEEEIGNLLNFEYNDILYTLMVFEDYSNSIYPICMKYDEAINYTLGSKFKIPVHVEQYNISGQEVLWLREWYDFYDSFFDLGYDFNINSISNFNYFASDITSFLDEQSQPLKGISQDSSLVIIDYITGYTNSEKTVIEYLSITITPKENEEIELNTCTAAVTYGNETNLTLDVSLVQNVSATTPNLFATTISEISNHRLIDFLDSTKFGVISTNDADGSILETVKMNDDDEVNILVNLSAIIKENNGLLPGESITVSFTAEEGLSIQYSAVAPNVFPIRIVKFQ
jgi:archaellin